MALTREQILNIDDIKIKEIEVPAWDGQTVFIKQLTRGQQDRYLRRRVGDMQIKTGKDRGGEMTASLYGHDPFLCVCAICDEDGKQLFKESETKLLEDKLGEAIGFIAIEIVRFSGMAADAGELEEAKN